MKPTQERISEFWCTLMHAEAMWPSHGQYECRTCGRRHLVCWEQPLPVVARPLVLSGAALAHGALTMAAESRMQCS